MMEFTSQIIPFFFFFSFSIQFLMLPFCIEQKKFRVECSSERISGFSFVRLFVTHPIMFDARPIDDVDDDDDDAEDG